VTPRHTPRWSPSAARWAARAADAEALGFVEGPPGFDAAAALRALGVAYEADVE
jgi:hypothetical protein